MSVAPSASKASIFSLDIIRMDFPDKTSILKDILTLLQLQYQNNGFLDFFPLKAHQTSRRPVLHSSKSQPINVLQEFGPHFHKDNLLLQYLILQYFISVPLSPSLSTRYQMYSDLGQAYGRKSLLSDDEMNALMTKFYAPHLRKFLSNPIISNGIILYDIMQSMKMYDLFHIFDRIQRVATKITEENEKGAGNMTDRRLARLVRLDQRREELSMEEVVESFLPIKEEYERDLEKVHRILEGNQDFMEEFQLLAATLGKDFEFASLLSVPSFNEELKAMMASNKKRTFVSKVTMKNKRSSK
jgi:hypothetical protein